MIKRHSQLFLTLLVLLATPLFAELRVGSAQVDITPPKGMPMAGYYSVRLNEGVHDPLYAKAIVFEVGGKKAAMVSCDLVAIPREFVLEAREIISRETGVPGDNVIVSATHTHTGPEMGLRLKGVDQKTMKLATGYHKRLPGLIAQSVKDAEAKLTASKISAGVGHVDSVAFVRRFWMQDGTVGWNPGKKNPKIVRPTAEIDPSLPVVFFQTPDDNPLALYVNYANHLDTVGGMEFSKDYPHALAQSLGNVFGPKMVTLFTIGTAGNINHIDVKSATPQNATERRRASGRSSRAKRSRRCATWKRSTRRRCKRAAASCLSPPPSSRRTKAGRTASSPATARTRRLRSTSRFTPSRRWTC